ncbi:MAG: hypothetical protein ABH874_01915 [Methanobacteriota archaeon]
MRRRKLSKLSEKLKKSFRSYIAIYVFTFILVVLLLIAFMQLYITFFGQMRLDPSAVTASATMILVFVTTGYALATYRIVQESQKARRVDLLRYRLEKLYSPLKYHGHLGQLTMEFRDKLKRDLYLASKELQPLLEEYIKLVHSDDFQLRTTKEGEMFVMIASENEEKNLAFLSKLKSQIDNDFDEFRRELLELTP